MEKVVNHGLAEGQGFEPWIPLGMLVFKTSAFNRSATPPRGREFKATSRWPKPATGQIRMIWLPPDAGMKTAREPQLIRNHT